MKAKTTVSITLELTLEEFGTLETVSSEVRNNFLDFSKYNPHLEPFNNLVKRLNEEIWKGGKQ